MTEEMARQIHHIEEAVDSYIRAFIRVLLLRYYGLPMARVTSYSRSLPKEHLALEQKHFSTVEARAEYLNQQGVSEEQ